MSASGQGSPFESPRIVVKKVLARPQREGDGATVRRSIGRSSHWIQSYSCTSSLLPSVSSGQSSKFSSNRSIGSTCSSDLSSFSSTALVEILPFPVSLIVGKSQLYVSCTLLIEIISNFQILLPLHCIIFRISWTQELQIWWKGFEFFPFASSGSSRSPPSSLGCRIHHHSGLSLNRIPAAVCAVGRILLFWCQIHLLFFQSFFRMELRNLDPFLMLDEFFGNAWSNNQLTLTNY